MTRQEACHALLGIVVALYELHSYRIEYQPQADSTPSFQVVLLLSRVVSWLKVISDSAAAKRVSTCLLRFNLDVVQDMDWLSAEGVNRIVNSVNKSNETHERVRNVLCA